MINSLAQVVLKLTVPGVPDIYQGNEAWDFSLVDPDNRRDVDYSVLRKLADSSATASPGELFSRWETGEIKLDVTRRLLRFRHEHPQLFSAGTYTPLEISGGFADHVVGFIREEGDERLLVLVPRLPSSLPWPPIGTAWADTRAAVGASAAAIPWTNLLSGSDIILDQTIMLADAFAELPVAVLHARRA
jgi:(1->4)-alpha-D-glucan 1-alpha-D-glucosylmutase